MKIRSFTIKFLFIVSVLLILDYSAYVYTNNWFEKLKRELPIGTSVEMARVYLVEERLKHHISGLTED